MLLRLSPMLKLHHLEFSRSTRILWLLEETRTEYQLVRHRRRPGLRAPESITEVHPSGKLPIIEDGQFVLAESAVILAYINERYGAGEYAPPPGTDARFRHDEWLHAIEGTIGFPIMLDFYGRLTGGLSTPLSRIVDADVRIAISRLERVLKDNPYITGSLFTIADIQLLYLLEIAEAHGFLAEATAVRGYSSRLRARLAYRRAIQIGGPILQPAL
jgi:glutathione S-transferase